MHLNCFFYMCKYCGNPAPWDPASPQSVQVYCAKATANFSISSPLSWFPGCGGSSVLVLLVRYGWVGLWFIQGGSLGLPSLSYLLSFHVPHLLLCRCFASR